MGASARWGLVEQAGDTTWPWAVLAANLVGCAVLGFVVTRWWGRGATTSTYVGVTTGLCGSLTTFSSFAVDLAVFLDEGRTTDFVSYLVVSVVGGLVVFVAGSGLGRQARAGLGR